MNRIPVLIVVGIIAGGFVRGTDAQQRGASPAAEVTETGADTFAAHCASCHGRDGKGDGPTAPSLRQKPADLTTIARHRGGTFPRTDMADFILGRGKRIGAHGTRDMPVWGPLFKELNPFDSRVDVRVERLLDYIQSLQVK
jgi:mono/diheme cytochrome c family protein